MRVFRPDGIFNLEYGRILLLNCQQFFQGVHYLPVWVRLQFLGSGYSVGDSSKVYSGRLGCFRIYRAVAYIEGLGFADM